MSESTQKVTVNASLGLGSVWFIGWLFTIGFAGLSAKQGFIALVLWPYFLGQHMAEDPVGPPVIEAQP